MSNDLGKSDLGKNNLSKKEINNGIVDMKNNVKTNTKISAMDNEMSKDLNSKEINSVKDDVNVKTVNNSANSVYNEQISVNLDNIVSVCEEWIHLQTPAQISEFGNYLPKIKLINFFLREITPIRINIPGTNNFEIFNIKRTNNKIRFILATNYGERSIWTRSNAMYEVFWNKYRKPRWQNFRKYLFRDANKDEVIDFLINFMSKRVEINKTMTTLIQENNSLKG